MSRKKVGRGRPIGTGVDDTARLKKIAAMIAADPSLKPTTAIKAIGVTDPSSVRRLRDKFTSMQGVANVPASPGKSEPQRARAVALKAAKETAKRSAPRPETPAATPAPHPAPKLQARASIPTPELADPTAWVAMWCGLSLQAITTTAMIQMAVVEHVLRLPHVASALKHHVLFNEFATAFAHPRPEFETTLH